MAQRPPQLDLFADYAPSLRVEPCDPHVEPAERPRLSSQCEAILERLRRGPATNRELAEIALKYGGRISDLRAAGYTIKCEPVSVEKGLFRYELVNGLAKELES